MEKPNVFRTSKFYMEEGDTLYMEIDYAGGSDTLTIELSREDGTVEAVPTADLVDLDGNVYTTVTINNQEWIVENFKSTKYADGSSIPVVSEDDVDDWFMPSIGELELVYQNIVAGGIGDVWGDVGQVMSSSVSPIAPNPEGYVWTMNFRTGAKLQNLEQTDTGYTVPCRSFAGSPGDYSIRDRGPAGGYIFAYDSGLYYEVAAGRDLNVDVIGLYGNFTISTNPLTTGVDIGDGSQNTDDIIADHGGSFGSVAIVCRDSFSEGWINNTEGAMCYYDNDKTTYETLYGALYNWWAVNNASGLAYLERNGVREAGWRVPTVTDWSNLIAFAGGLYGAGVKLRKDGPGIWTQTPNTATNDYGFGIMPAGRRDGTSGAFDEDGSTGKLWTSVLDLSPTAPFYVNFFFLVIDAVTILKIGEEWGLSIRLVRDV